MREKFDRLFFLEKKRKLLSIFSRGAERLRWYPWTWNS